MATNVVAEVRMLATAALKKAHKLNGAELTPAKWASEAGFQGSAASPLREHLARVSGNGCGRSGRYPAMAADTLLETLDLADNYKATQEQKRKDTLARQIGSKVRPAATKGARQAKAKATGSTPSPRRKAKVKAEA